MNDAIPILLLFVLPIVIVSMVFKHRQKVLDAEIEMKELEGNSASDEVLKEIQTLKERVSTLEAIVTDEKYELNKEFSRL